MFSGREQALGLTCVPRRCCLVTSDVFLEPLGHTERSWLCWLRVVPCVHVLFMAEKALKDLYFSTG